MNKLRSASFLLVAALSLQGCDEVRSFYGKPTSAQVAIMKDSIMAARPRQSLEKDTVCSLPVDTVKAAPAIPDSSSAASVSSERGIRRYNVVAGAFSDSTNAAKLEKSLRESGGTPVRMRMKNGLFVICALSTDDAADAERLAEEMLADGKDAWVYDTRTKKHRD